MKKNQQPKRSLKFNLNDGTSIDLDIGKHIQLHTNKPAIYIELMPDGKYRLAYDVSIIPDFTKVLNMEVVRGDVIQ